jgi:hypothetical protein
VSWGYGPPGQTTGGWWPFGWHSARRQAHSVQLAPGPGDAREAEINDLLAGVDGRDGQFRLLLAAHLRPLVQRGVPPRGIEAGPVPRAARLRFADGTTLVVSSLVPGDLAVLASAMRLCSARPLAVIAGPGGHLRLLLTCPGRSSGLTLSVIGLDQPD